MNAQPICIDERVPPGAPANVRDADPAVARTLRATLRRHPVRAGAAPTRGVHVFLVKPTDSEDISVIRWPRVTPTTGTRSPGMLLNEPNAGIFGHKATTRYEFDRFRRSASRVRHPINMSDRSSYPPRVSGHPPEPPQPPDLALARRIVEGDRDALAHAYREHANSALRTAMRFLRSTPDAEDAVHNVFQSLPKTLRTYQGRGNLRGWICKATSRAALMILRRRRRLSEVSLAAASAEQRATPVGDPETKIMLERAIQDLPERFRLVYLLKDVEGFSHADVASLLDMTEEASRVRLHRARKYLRGRMQ